MISLRISSLGSFMSGLFSRNTFDSFLLAEGTLQTAVTWTVDGKVQKDFFEKEIRDDPALLPYDHVAWSEIRPSLRELIGQGASGLCRLLCPDGQLQGFRGFYSHRNFHEKLYAE